MRRAPVLLAIALSACSQGQDPNGAGAGQAVACAHGAQGDWAVNCRLERTELEDGEMLVVRRADGAFRRFLVQDDGRGLAAADGAAEVQQHRVGGALEVSVGEDRYRLPLLPGAPIGGT